MINNLKIIIILQKVDPDKMQKEYNSQLKSANWIKLTVKSRIYYRLLIIIILRKNKTNKNKKYFQTINPDMIIIIENKEDRIIQEKLIIYKNQKIMKLFCQDFK